jgi:Trm5-related predicted tRNA methylase
METKEIKKRTTDELISYLLNSKKEMQEEIKNDVHKPEFQEALRKLRAKNKNKS